MAKSRIGSIITHPVAGLAEAVTWTGSRIPLLGSLLWGKDPRVQRMAYRHVPADQITAAGNPWVEIEGDPEGSPLPLPRLYGRVATIRVAPAALEAHNSSQIPALVWKLGQAAMAAPLSPEQTEFIKDQGYYNMLVGRGTLQAAFGLYDPTSGSLELQSPVDNAGQVEVMQRRGLPENAIVF